MAELVKLVFDLRNGTASIEAPSDVVATILERLEVLLPKLGEHALRAGNPAQLAGAVIAPAEPQLLGLDGRATAPEPGGARLKRRRAPVKPGTRAAPPEGFDRVLHEPFDRSELYAQAIAAADVLNRALLVLHLAGVQFGVSSLTPKEIAMVLVERFRQKGVRQSVQSALDRAVQRGVVHKEGPRYKLLAPGVSRVTDLIDKVSIGRS